MGSGISLANKSQLLFGFAVVCIIAAALSVPWFRSPAVVREGQLEVARQLAQAWLSGDIQLSAEALRDVGHALTGSDRSDDPFSMIAAVMRAAPEARRVKSGAGKRK